MNPNRCHQIVEYIRMQSEFPFDGMDVEEDLDGVLRYYGIHSELSHEDRSALLVDLLPMGIEAELSEVMRLMSDPV